jgi:hypothetical protein
VIEKYGCTKMVKMGGRWVSEWVIKGSCPDSAVLCAEAIRNEDGVEDGGSTQG